MVHVTAVQGAQHLHEVCVPSMHLQGLPTSIQVGFSLAYRNRKEEVAGKEKHTIILSDMFGRVKRAVPFRFLQQLCLGITHDL